MQSVSSPSIKVDNVSITYRTAYEKIPTLRTTLLRLGRREKLVREIEAVKDVSFAVDKGTVLGVVGANGAGKSTLVRTIAGILPPTEGRAEVLEEKYDEIVDFAELGEFMDLPMRAYSSGMYGRLAFSVAIHMDPDILLIDEALSVGDAKFRRKSFQRMRDLCAEDRTIVLVSHAFGSIRDLCHQAVWMNKGHMEMWGEANQVVDAYRDFLGVKEDRTDKEDL